MPDQSAPRHPVIPDIGRPVMAKANVRIPDVDWVRAIGGAVQRAVAVVGWSHKEAAAKVGADDAEFGKWINGTRRPQLDRLFAVAELRSPLIIALAQLGGADVEISTSITIRKVA